MKKRNVPIFLLVSLLLLTACLSCGFALIRYLSVDTEKLFWAPYNRSQADSIIENAHAEYADSAAKLMINEVMFGCNEETGSVTGVLFLQINNQAVTLDIVSIPVSTQYTMTSSLYNRLTLSNVTLPQTVRFSEFLRYYSEKDRTKALDHGAAVVSEIMGLSADYVTAVPDHIFSSLFSFRDDLTPKLSADRDSLCFSVPNSTGSLSSYIKAMYPDILTNWELSDRLRYIDTFDSLSERTVNLRLIPGEKMNAGYYLN